MPASWNSFISNVSDKFSSKNIGSPEELGKFLADQYVSATVNKAQSPYGNLHRKGNDKIMEEYFTRGIKMLYEEKSPSFEEKQKDPLYSDLEEKIKEIDPEEEKRKIKEEFYQWIIENSETLPNFNFSQFFSQFPNFPSTIDQALTEVARKIIKEYDGSIEYLYWIASLRYGRLRDYGETVLSKIRELTSYLANSPIKVGDGVKASVSFNNSQINVSGKVINISPQPDGTVNYTVEYSDSQGNKKDGIATSGNIERQIGIDEIRNIESVNISKKIFQEDHESDPEGIPDYVTVEFITKFTYIKSSDKEILPFSQSDYVTIPYELASSDLYSGNVQSILSGDLNGISGLSSTSTEYIGGYSAAYFYSILTGNINSSRSRKLLLYEAEVIKFRQIRRDWIQDLADSFKKEEDPDDDNDPYRIMAKGIINYWKSTISSPLTSTPPVFPCIVTPPGNGTYTPIYYGSQKRLADHLRRAFNTGKRFKLLGDSKSASTLVATALAFSLAEHLLELKFIYNGGIPTPSGTPSPMIGFIPLVF